MTAVRLPVVADLTNPRSLECIVGPVAAIRRVELRTSGFSGGRHERVRVELGDGTERRLVLKLVRPAQTWTAYRTGDTVGREAALLAEPRLAGVWEVFQSPYLAFAAEENQIGLLMDDLSDSLVPEVDSPLSEAQEDALLGSLAATHARFWEAEALQVSWLTPTFERFHILHPSAGPEELRRAMPHPVFDLVNRGWEIALQRLPARVAASLMRPAEEIAADFSSLPRTLLHGDAKVANFAFLPGGRIAAFDWAVMGVGPATLDFGYYLAVNASRLARSREGVIARYRQLLEARLGRGLPAALWEELVTIAVVGGAGMLLWSKALAVDAGSPGAETEWQWWVDALERVLG